MMEKRVKGYFCPHCGSTDVDSDSCDIGDWINDYEMVVFLQFRCSSCGKEFEAGVSLRAAGFNFSCGDTRADTDYIIEEE